MARGAPMDDPGKRSEPTLDVLPDEAVESPPVERREPTLDRLLDELEAEVRPGSQPAPATLPPRAPARPPPPPPSPPRGLGRPVVPLPRALKTTAAGIAAPPSEAAPADGDEVRERARQWAEEIERAPDGPRKGLSCFELGRLHEGALGDPGKAAAWYQKAIANRPDHLPSLRAARRLALARGDHRAACTLLDAEARITADPRRKASLLYTKGRILEDLLGQPREARELYATAAELDRTNVSVLIALEQRCREDGDGAALGPLYERIAQAVVVDPRHRAALLVERARLLEHAEKRVDAALEVYELALSLDPRASGALDGIERLAAAHGRTRERIRCLERRAGESVDATERAVALYAVGRLYAERLGSRDEAIAALERACAEWPDEPWLLEELAAQYEQADRVEALLDVLARIARGAASSDAVGLWQRIGELEDDRLGRPAQARRAYERALALDPTYEPALHALGRLYQRDQAWDALIAIWVAEADHASDAERRAAAHARIAEVLEAQKGDVEGAIAHYARALVLVPGHAASFKALTRLYAETDRPRELLALHERAVELAAEVRQPARGKPALAVGRKPVPSPAKLARPDARPSAPTAGGSASALPAVVATTHLLEIGAIYERELGEHAQAAHAYRRILELEPTHLGAWQALQRVTERAGRHAELVDALEREAALYGEGPRVVALLTRAAQVLEGPLESDEGAIARYRRVLELDPGHTPASQGLTRIYRRLGRWEDVLELHRRELERVAPDKASREERESRVKRAAFLLSEMGRLCEERLGDEGQALDSHRRAIQLDPTHRPSLRALTRHLAARRQHAELARVLEFERSGATDADARARIALRLGEVHEELGEPERAASAYESALGAVPGFPPAASALRRLRATQGAFRKLVEQLEQEAGEASTDARAVERWAYAGEVWMRALDDPRRAAECYEHALERAPRHLETLLALERLYRKLGRPDALARTYGALARTLTDPAARVATLRELARLEARGHRGIDELREIHEAILSLSPDDPGALEALERIAIDTGDRALLERVDERWIATSDPRTAASYRVRLAESLEARGDAAALDVLRAALHGDPESIAAARALTRAGERHGAPAAIVEGTRREAALTHDPKQAARLLVRAARLAEKELGDAEGAARDYERALELAPDDADAAAGCAAVWVAARRADRAADRLARAATSTRTAERAAALWMDVARLQLELLDNPTGALVSLDRILRSFPQHVPALRRTAEVHARQGRWADAARALGAVIAASDDREVLQEAHLELARVWAERLGDLPRAMASLQAVLALEADHPEALARLAEAAARTGDLEGASATLRRLVESAPTPAARAAAWLRTSDVHLARGDRDAARGAALAALALEGPDGAAATRHRELCEGPADWEAHAERLGAWLAAHPGDARGRGASLELARILREELGEPGRAAAVLEERAKDAPTDVELRRTLARALALAGRPEPAIAELRSLLSDNLTRTELWRDLAQLLRSTGDLEGARRALAPLVLLGTAHGEEAREVGAARGRSVRVRPHAFGPALLEALYPMRRAGTVLGLLRALAPVLGKVYPADFEGFGLSSRDRVATRSTEPLRVLADRLGAAFGLGEVHLYVHRVRTRGVGVELTTPPSILLPALLAEQSESHVAFALARAMANVAMGLHAVDKLTPREVEIVLAAAARHVAPGFGAGLTNEEILEDVGRQLYRALPRRSRKDVDELARAFVTSGERDFAAVTEAVVASACRVALVLCDDLCAAVDVLKRTERDLADLTGARLVLHPSVARLVRFWVSADADALRARAGFSEPTVPRSTDGASA